MNINKLLFIKNINLNSLRTYAFKSDLKIKWNRPEKIPCYDPRKSGDLSKLSSIDENQFLKGYEQSKELKSANDEVKNLFVLKNQPRRESISILSDQLVSTVQRHILDYGSMESKLAKMTTKIRSYQEIMSEFPRNKRLKVELKELIDKRKKFLKYLRRWDYKRFEWVLDRLDLVYKSPPSEFHWITRKDSLRKLTDTYCENLRNKKLEEYRKNLESQQIPFLMNKIKKLQSIQEMETTHGIQSSVSNKEIDDVKQQLIELRKKLNG